MTTSSTASRRDPVHPTTDHLQARRTALLDELAANLAHAGELATTIDELTGLPDLDTFEAREAAERAGQHIAETIADIEAALRRIDDGTYGRCEGCGRPIAPERLEAIPHARLCVACPGAATRLVG